MLPLDNPELSEAEAVARLTSAEEGAAAPEITVEPEENSSISMMEVS